MSKVQKLKKSGGIAGGYATPKQGSKKKTTSARWTALKRQP